MPLTSYSPAIAESYSADELQWRPLPVPDAVLAARDAQLLALPDQTSIRSGRYYCSVIDICPAGFWENDPAAVKWKTNGEACHELPPNSSQTIVMFGILDLVARRHHVTLGFSG